MANRKRVLYPILAMLFASGITSAGTDPASIQRGTTMKVRIAIAGAAALTATLDNNDTARDFAALLPLQLTLDDYAATEKISDLPRPLTKNGAPAGYKPSAGDLAYYAPWSNLAVFHKDFAYSSGLIKLGKLDTGIETLRRAGPLKATISLVTD